ncbi:hypothetical protein F4859DRAFT_72857 [Xylaria cf. heliscus]|nr:hypothetical protein F4859DRAFT_72857 [Xylaria cf. heliscus]
MDQPPEQIQSELESFRRQWREEVSSRTKKPATTAPAPAPAPAPSIASTSASRPIHRPGPSSAGSHRPPRRHEPPSHTKGPTSVGKLGQLDDDEEDYVPAPVFDGDGSSSLPKKGGHTLGDGEEAKEPKTALDFYEHAVERETTGKLGDSLQLYRKAFRMDEGVDRKYRDKHFAGRWGKAAAQQHQQQQQQHQQQINPSNAAATVPNTAHHSLEDSNIGGGSGEAAIPLSFPELIASFAGLKVEGAPPECEGVDPPPCPMAALPDEILVHILRDVATTDVGDFVRLAQVCRRLAYLVATEDQIWRRVCVGSEFGFAGMHRHFQRSITWEPLSLPEALTESADADAEAQAEAEEVYTLEELHDRRAASSHARTLSLYRNVAAGGYATWQAMFRRRPRVRFNGCYISTVNYIRPGVNAGQHLSWNTPVHIVTYYRYLRLFRDGTAISLTTTDEPAHVVHHLTRENVPSHRGSTQHHHHQHQHLPHLPQPVMAAALKGRWRLSSAQDSSSTNPANPPSKNPSTTTAPLQESEESDLYIETEGVVGAKYTYRLDLSLRSAGGKRSSAARNNKLVWRGFWSYNRLTDDWAQFTLKNDKPFFFSRVKSYGVGE